MRRVVQALTAYNGMVSFKDTAGPMRRRVSPKKVSGCRPAVVWVSALAGWIIGACAVAVPLRAEEVRLGSEAACSEIRASISRLAEAERNQAFALRLMPKGQPTPMVEERLTELRARIGDLREVLRRVRQGVSPEDQYVNECVNIGFRSLVEAEEVSSEVGNMVMAEGAGLGLGPGLKSTGPKLPEPPLPGASERPE
jgi:hypothetical protein